MEEVKRIKGRAGKVSKRKVGELPCTSKFVKAPV